MMQETLKELLTRYRQKRCTTQDLVILKEILGNEKYAQQILEILTEDIESIQFHESDENVDFDAIFTSIKTKIAPDQAKAKPIKKARKFDDPLKIMMNRFMRIASVLILGIIIGGVFIYYNSRLTYTQKVNYCEVSAPLGAKSYVVLPDGTKVWLNAGSNIKYSTDFSYHNRNVRLEGEAYFKVAKDKELPFIVNASGLQIRAVGTEFNVKAYDNDGLIETTLIEGKITLKNTLSKHSENSDVVLIPNQKALFIKKNGHLLLSDLPEEVHANKNDIQTIDDAQIYILKKIDPLPVISWKDNRLIIRSETLDNLAVKLERKYNVHIVFNSADVKKFKFTGTLEDETLQQILDVIKLSAPIRYQLDGKTATLFEDQTLKDQFIKHMKQK